MNNTVQKKSDTELTFRELLPIGSVVLLKDAQKKVMIIGYLPMKGTENGNLKMYDYIGVPYPEGFTGAETGLLFQHHSIIEIVFSGYSNRERELFIDTLQKIADSTDETVREKG